MLSGILGDEMMKMLKYAIFLAIAGFALYYLFGPKGIITAQKNKKKLNSKSNNPLPDTKGNRREDYSY